MGPMLENIINLAIAAAEIETGGGSVILNGRNGPLSGLPRGGMRWVEEEEGFLEENHGRLGEDESQPGWDGRQ